MSDYPDGAAAMRAYVQLVAKLPPTLDRLDDLTGLEQYLAEWAEDNPHLSSDEREDLRAQFTAALEHPHWAT